MSRLCKDAQGRTIEGATTIFLTGKEKEWRKKRHLLTNENELLFFLSHFRLFYRCRSN
jgi:hypothetical protein